MFGLPAIHDKKGLDLISYKQGLKGIGANSYLSKQALKGGTEPKKKYPEGHIIIIKYQGMSIINIYYST